MKSAYIDYSMSVIVSRALPDVRDGLKPVHRRVLYGMYGLGLTSNQPVRKSARIVGDVLGKYHPHGDSSVYDAMARLAQPWNMRYMLVQGQGNFGSVDGDPVAAMRYTEAKLQKLAEEVIEDIDKDTVDFKPNFDESLQEPVVLRQRRRCCFSMEQRYCCWYGYQYGPHNLQSAVMLSAPISTIQISRSMK